MTVNGEPAKPYRNPWLIGLGLCSFAVFLVLSAVWKLQGNGDILQSWTWAEPWYAQFGLAGLAVSFMGLGTWLIGRGYRQPEDVTPPPAGEASGGDTPVRQVSEAAGTPAR
ncbi:hypothetical protein [Longispora albida]|uniref:hypothetical protein n=1 Tax=Longispora albida TaxID=203523 RepID=UPI0003819DCA|nr:hypothetical protein [Longispora albida]